MATRLLRTAVLFGTALSLASACGPRLDLPVLSTVAPTHLIDSDGAGFDTESLAGEVWVAHFMFTRCGGPCPRMAAEFAGLQRELGPLEHLHWVSVSADPTWDTPEVLTEYASRFEADTTRWHFLTGDPQGVTDLAEKSFLLPVERPPEGEDGGLITHSLKYAVVDAKGQVRAFHDHFDTEAPAALKLELEALLQETR